MDNYSQPQSYQNFIKKHTAFENIFRKLCVDAKK